MPAHPVAAGKSSLEHIDQELAFSHILRNRPAVYLDLACGAGLYTLALAERVAPGSDIHALDLWEDGIESLRRSVEERGLEHVHPGVADMTSALPLDSDTVDVCLLATVLHDLRPEVRQRALSEVRRVLAPNGTLALIEFKKLDRGPGPKRENRIGPDDARALLSPLGFAPGHEVDLGEFAYLMEFTVD